MTVNDFLRAFRLRTHYIRICLRDRQSERRACIFEHGHHPRRVSPVTPIRCPRHQWALFTQRLSLFLFLSPAPPPSRLLYGPVIVLLHQRGSDFLQHAAWLTVACIRIIEKKRREHARLSKRRSYSTSTISELLHNPAAQTHARVSLRNGRMTARILGGTPIRARKAVHKRIRSTSHDMVWRGR